MTRIHYYAGLEPPAPFVNVSLSQVGDLAQAMTHSAQIDSGADRTVVPQAVVERLSLDAIGTISVQGFGSEVLEVPIYSLAIQLGSFSSCELTVVSHPGEVFVLLGRDFLNRFRIVLDGPNQIVEFS